MRGLRGKVALVAGAAPGNIGAATAIRLAEEGSAVVVADLNESAAGSVADEIHALGGNAIARSFDITDESSYAGLVDVTVKEFGRLDGLFNAASDLSPANLGHDTDVLSVSLEVWRHTIDVTLSGTMYGIRHALPIMIAQGGGAIVNTMSTIVWMGEDTRVAYQSAKAGLFGLTRHAATLGGKHGVRCNSVAPGVILTGSALANTTEEYRHEILESLRSNRLGAPDDIAAMVAFLFSDDGAYVTGQTILVDGGANFT
jgi:NAD(P)-dependent dehydrogenase (short-subunit alcohol dehydrogenase family)